MLVAASKRGRGRQVGKCVQRSYLQFPISDGQQNQLLGTQVSPGVSVAAPFWTQTLLKLSPGTRRVSYPNNMCAVLSLVPGLVLQLAPLPCLDVWRSLLDPDTHSPPVAARRGVRVCMISSHGTSCTDTSPLSILLLLGPSYILPRSTASCAVEWRADGGQSWSS